MPVADWLDSIFTHCRTIQPGSRGSRRPAAIRIERKIQSIISSRGPKKTGTTNSARTTRIQNSSSAMRLSGVKLRPRAVR